MPLPMAGEDWMSSVAINVRSFSFCLCFWSASDNGMAVGTVSRTWMDTGKKKVAMETRTLEERIAAVGRGS